MAVRYVQVQAISDLFAPAVRAYGNIAIIGDTTFIKPPPSSSPPSPVPSYYIFADPNSAMTQFTDQKTLDAISADPKSAVTLLSNLVKAIQMAFQQTPGPSVVYGIVPKSIAISSVSERFIA